MGRVVKGRDKSAEQPKVSNLYENAKDFMSIADKFAPLSLAAYADLNASGAYSDKEKEGRKEGFDYITKNQKYEVIYSVGEKAEYVKNGYEGFKGTNEPSKGLNYTLFMKKEGNEPPELVIAFRGTDGFSDLLTDASLIPTYAGGKFSENAPVAIASQAVEAMNLMERIKQLQTELDDNGNPKLPSNIKINLTGHSLGGHIANFIGRAYPEMVDNVVGFNSANNKRFVANGLDLNQWKETFSNTGSDKLGRIMQANAPLEDKNNNIKPYFFNFIGKTDANIVANEKNTYNPFSIAGNGHEIYDFWRTIRAQNLLVQMGHSLDNTTNFLTRKYENYRTPLSATRRAVSEFIPFVGKGKNIADFADESVLEISKHILGEEITKKQDIQTLISQLKEKNIASSLSIAGKRPFFQNLFGGRNVGNGVLYATELRDNEVVCDSHTERFHKDSRISETVICARPQEDEGGMGLK